MHATSQLHESCNKSISCAISVQSNSKKLAIEVDMGAMKINGKCGSKREMTGLTTCQDVTDTLGARKFMTVLMSTRSCGDCIKLVVI